MFSSVLLIVIVALSIVLMLARPRGIAEVWWVGSGACLLVVLRLIPLRLAGHAIAEGLDVYLFLIGMMLLSALAQEHGVFDWLSSVAVSGARGSNVRLFTLIYLFGVVVTVFLSNDATAVVLTPAVLAAVRRARVKPLPYLYACAMVANAASFALPISNPANLVVFRGEMPALGRWLTAFGVSSLLSITATYVVLRVVFRKALAAGPEATEEASKLSGNGRLVLAGLAATAVALLTASALGIDLGWPTCGMAALVTGAVSIRARHNPVELLGRISWKTLALVAALFILVDAVIGIGALTEAIRLLHEAEGLAPAWGVLAVSFSIGLGNNLVNNLPLGLIVGAATQAAHLQMLMRAAVMMGIDLGSNLSITGSLATILWLIALRSEKLNVGFFEYLKVGVWVMPAGILAAVGGALAMHFLHFL
uniref:Arsenical pump membrane protein-arsB n=1 Tax=mine drainage metagenome TaxID=410659 RepID=E6PWR5_9ZZZZ